MRSCSTGVVAVVCFGLIAQCLTQVTLIEGDVYIEGIFSLQYGVNDDCGDVIVTSLQYLEAVRWTIEMLNNVSYLHETKIGLRVHRTCESVKRALDIGFDIAVRLGQENADILAVIGPDTSDEAEGVSRLFSALPVDRQPLQVWFSTPNAGLSDHGNNRNLFRINPSLEIQQKTIAAFLSEMTWTYVAVLFEEGQVSLVDDLEHQVTKNGKITCFAEKVLVNVSKSSDEVEQQVTETLEGLHLRQPKIQGLIVFGNEKLVLNVMNAFTKLSSQTNKYYVVPVTLLVETYPFVLDLTPFNNVSKGIFRGSSQRNKIGKFDTHWQKYVKNKLYEASHLNPVLNCSLSQCNAINGSMGFQSVFVRFAIQGVMAIANAIKHSACSGRSCLDQPKNTFAHLMETLEVDFVNNFEFVKIPEFSDLDILMHFQNGKSEAEFKYRTSDVFYDYYIYNRRDETSANWPSSEYEQVFAYSKRAENGVLSINLVVDYYNGTAHTFPNIRNPQCPDGFVCSECPSRRLADIVVTEGDMFVVGIVPVHTKLDDPLTCGSIKAGGLDVAEAIKFAVNLAKEEYSRRIPQGKIGSIIIDSCNDPQIISARILQLHDKGIYENGSFREVKSKILGYVGGWVSDVSITAATLLTRLGYVQVSYGSTSPQLSDRSKYPYFMRVVPSDVLQGEKMIEVVKNMGSSLVQILYSDTAYGIGGMESLRNAAVRHGICVSQAVIVKQESTVNLNDIISRLTQPESPKIVMVFLSSFDVAKLISRLSEMRGYVFVASEGWGNRDIIANYRNFAGSVTLAHDLIIDGEFKDYIQSISENEKKDVWLAEYIESYFNCYFDWSFDKQSKARVCNASDVLRPRECYRVSNKDCFKIETWSPFAITAVIALLQGSRATLDEFCPNSTHVCPEYHKHPDRLVKHVLPIRVAYDKLSEKPLFDNNQDGMIPYNKYRIHVDERGAYYQELNEDYTFNVSTCSLIRNPQCNACKNTTGSTSMTGPSEQRYLIPMLVFIIVFVILATTVMVSVVFCKKKLYCFKGLALDDTYLHPSSPHFDFNSPNSPATTEETDVSDESFRPHRETHMNFYIPDYDNRNMVQSTELPTEKRL